MRASALVGIVVLLPAAFAGAPTSGFGEGWVLIEAEGPATLRFDMRWGGATLFTIHLFRMDGTALVPGLGVGASGDILMGGAAGSDLGVGMFTGRGVLGRSLPEGTHRVAFVVGGDPREWTYSVEGSSGWHEIARGTTVHSIEPRDFGPVGADASVLAAGAYVGVDAHKVVTIEREMVGLAGHGALVPGILAGIQGLSVVGPDTDRKCPCGFRQWGTATPAGPGDYDFRLTSAGVRAIHGPLVVVADVPLFE